MKQISIITGGSSGLGKELARELIRRSQNVCIIARDETKIQQTIKELGGNIIGYSGNVDDEAFIKQVFDNLQDKGYYVNYLYNCAGIGIFGIPEDMNKDKIYKVIDANVIGLMCITYEACRRMSSGGFIINIMSTAGLRGNPNESLYCASKWAIRGFTEALKAYYKKTNIHVVGVYPGGMNTPFWSAQCGMNPDVNKFMDPNEVARQIIFSVDEQKTMYVSDIIIERK
ncbi:MAG: SDR family NAD(P)-dependent oxidoreductase [Anaeroplasmataceae bacterium]|nr:SDR family NAD(P)-dependent oxidoreductase [Anaeroplasmataceae bacterium]